MLCSSVRGQERARSYFGRAIASGRISHAYLLVGPEGVGKRRFANELAGALLCRGRDGASAVATDGACGTCASCAILDSGNHPGLFIIDPPVGKTIEIDTVRAANESLALRGHDRRVLIFDGADRMTPPASNAILKTLEEPPPGIVFLLVSSRPAHLLDTIHSRAHRVPFTSLGPEEFDAALRDQGTDPDSYPALHLASAGSPGAALALLEGVESCGGLERFGELLAGTGAERPETLVEFVPAQGKETGRQRVRRLLELLLVGLWGQRPDDPAARLQVARSAVALAELIRDLEGNQNPELILESLPAVLRGHHA